MLPQLTRFYEDCLVPEIVDSRTARNMPIREPQFNTCYLPDKLTDVEKASLSYKDRFLAQSRRDASFPDSILWTDESTFTPNGVINLRNRLYWSDKNPHAIRQGAFQYRWSINVWAGLIDNHVIGPYFLPPRLTGEFYEYFLDTELPGLLENIPLTTRRNMIYQHDGAPAHWSRGLRRLLDARFRDRWIGRGGPIIWPPRSPDLTPLDYFLWGHIKNLVEPQRNGTINEVREAIVAAFATITPHMVHQATQDVVRRARLCVQQRGGHFEQFLN
ncbi:uncharacterized protein [Cardiocondyla obscurior]|uniref:uncharacterized protein n=1 Tax=Cardiocondyla obscurior TaxID=286306 RepID=UPI0039655DE8